MDVKRVLFEHLLHFFLILALSGSTVCSEVCGGNLNQPSGVITSPDYPKNYSHSLNCIYIIRRPCGARITLTFLDFCLEGGTSCIYDYVEIRDGETSSSPLLGRRFCGASIPEDQRTSQNMMRITFKTDGSYTYRGFKASFTSECGGNFNRSTGAISSPCYPNKYTNNLTCEYVIQGPPGSKIILVFHNFNLEGNNCSSDYVVVRDGNSFASPFLTERFCGDVRPPVLRANQNIMRISFKTNSLNVFQGFNASFAADCKIDFYGQRGVISSPNYPQDLASNLSCVYVIRQPVGYIVTLNFSDHCSETNASSTFLEFCDNGSLRHPLQNVCDLKQNNCLYERVVIMNLHHPLSSVFSVRVTKFSQIYDQATTILLAPRSDLKFF